MAADPAPRAELSGASLDHDVALVTMSIVTVSGDYPFLAFGVNAVQACMKRFPDDTRLWLDYGLGKQFCAWIKSVLDNGGSLLLDEADMRVHVAEIISDLIRLGVPEATALETALLRHG